MIAFNKSTLVLMSPSIIISMTWYSKFIHITGNPSISVSEGETHLPFTITTIQATDIDGPSDGDVTYNFTHSVSYRSVFEKLSTQKWLTVNPIIWSM